jgi:hypothetical protein
MAARYDASTPPSPPLGEIVDNPSDRAPQGSMIVWKSYGSRRNPIRS